MNDRLDRRHIAPLLAGHFPEMAEAGSDEWHQFLNAVTGCAVSPEAENAAAFDEWRKALAGMGYEGVWSTTPLQAAETRARIAAKVEAAQKWRDEQAGRMLGELERLAKIGLRPRANP